jgi:hypothetical protein
MIDSIELKGDKEMQKLLESGVKRPMEKAVFRIGTLGQNEAKKNITSQRLIDTGQLRQSVVFTPMVDRTKGKITVGKKYGEQHEFGRRFYRERPFFRPMIEKVKKQSQNIIKEEVDKYLKSQLK